MDFSVSLTQGNVMVHYAQNISDKAIYSIVTSDVIDSLYFFKQYSYILYLMAVKSYTCAQHPPKLSELQELMHLIKYSSGPAQVSVLVLVGFANNNK